MSLLKTMMRYTGDEQNVSDGSDEFSALPPQPPQPAIYVSTDLIVHQVEDARLCPNDIDIESIRLRRLDPDYFSWLRSRMVTAQAAHQAGKLSDTAWETLRGRFNSLQEMAIEMFGSDNDLRCSS